MGMLLYGLCVVTFVFVLLLGYWGIARIISSLISLSEYAETLQNSRYQRLEDIDNLIPASLILPDCDVDDDIVATLENLMESNFPEYEVIAVCDGRNGKALSILREKFALIEIAQPIKKSVPMKDVRQVYRSPAAPNLIVVDKDFAGRYDALNTGLNVSRYPLIVALSAGRGLYPQGLQKLVSPFMLSYKVAAVGVLPRVSAKGKGLLSALQQVEYLRNFPAGLAVPGRKNLPLVPDAFGAFRKSAVIGAGGFCEGDDEAGMALRLFKGRRHRQSSSEIQMLADYVFLSPQVNGIGGLYRQRKRWQKEIISSLWHNRDVMFDANYGRYGMWDMPLQWLFEVIGPFLELLGCIVFPLAFAFGFISANFFWVFLAAEILFGVVVSLTATMSQQVIQSDLPSTNRMVRMVLCSILGNIGYRQLLLIFRVVGTIAPRQKYK